ncbi:unnamed protein product [Phytomonas sp. Hart1]|nr:unnamed protein product [Phytomonas sp. Hart1]|eukprot:CCW68475.1 unnamed protein product [Phytomonas sp. isolate Hart1]
MNRLSDHKAVVEAFFQVRLEEIQASELVTVLGTKKATRPKLLILSRPLAASGNLAGHAWILNLVKMEKDNRPKIKQAFAADRLMDITHNGSFDATFNFGASGMLSVSFGSKIQRDMFLASLKRFNEMKSRTSHSISQMDGQKDVDFIHGVLSPAFGSEVDTDAGSRVRKPYQEKRRVFSTEEEQHLLKILHEGDFDDIKGFQEKLFSSQKRAELAALNQLVTSVASWDDMRNKVMNLIHDVESLEGCIEQFSSNLLCKKAVIQEIEHANNALRCRQQNLRQLHVIVTELRDQLSLKPTAQALLKRFQSEPDSNLINFFAEDGNAETLSDAMKHMQRILQNPQLDSDYPIAAVSERKAFFIEQRLMVAQRSRVYIFSIIDAYKKQYLSDRMRFSGEDRLVWRLHTELTLKLFRINDIIQSLSRIDMEGFASTLRKYRTGMQEVYHVEIHQYFKGLRKQIKKANSSSGLFLLGSSEKKTEGISISMELNQTSGAPPMWRGTPLASPALTPRRSSWDDSANGSIQSSFETRNDERDHTLYIEFPSSTILNGIVLYPNCTIHRSTDSKTKLSCVIHCPYKLVRPNLAFAIALESTIACILYEESIINNCFGITEASPSTCGTAVSVEVESTKTPIIHSTSSSFSAFESNVQIFDKAAKDETSASGKQQEDADLFIESLVEVFGTDITRIPMEPLTSPRGDALLTSDLKRSSVRSDLGLPPRHPGSSNLSSLNDSLSHRGLTRETDSITFQASHTSITTNHVWTPQLIRKIHSCFLATELINFARFLADKCDRMYAIAALCAIQAYLRHPSKLMGRSTFCQCVLRDLEKIMKGTVMRLVAEQTESITGCRRRYMIRPTALLHCFSKMPTFILRMEDLHNSLSDEGRDRTQYASIVTSLVDQSFEALDAVTALKSTGSTASQDSKLNLLELLEKKVHSVMDRLNSDENKTLKRNFIQQYRHHAFFCAFYVALPSGSYAAELLREYYKSSKAKRSFYMDLYLTRVLLVKDFPNFGVFILSAEDLSNAYSEDELRHHRTLTVEAVKKVFDKLDKEFCTGVKSSATRMKKHFLREVVSGSNEESFHRTLLQRTWQKFSMLILRKYDFLMNLLEKHNYTGLTAPITRDEVIKLLSSF